MTDFIAEYAKHLRRLHRAESTISSYTETLYRLDRAIGAGLVAALPEELEEWLYNDAWANGTQSQRRAAVVGFFAFMTSPKRRMRLDYNPAADLPTVPVPRGRPRPVPMPLVEQVLAGAREPYRTWILIAVLGGARCMEIANLDREDVTAEEMLLRGKGGRSRLVPVHELIWTAIKPLPAGPIAVGSDGLRLTRKDVSRLGNRELCRLGAEVTMHQFRHTFGTETNEVTHDLRVVQELLGHASVATTQIYVEVRKESKMRAVAGLTLGSGSSPR